MTPDRLRVICTDKGTHGPRDLALVVWGADMSEGVAVWDASGDQTRLTPSAVRQSGRTTAAGHWRTTERRQAVTTHTRADGGTTFELPPCPTCGAGSPGRRLRDDTLARVVRATQDTPGTVLDISRIP